MDNKRDKDNLTDLVGDTPSQSNDEPRGGLDTPSGDRVELGYEK